MVTCLEHLRLRLCGVPRRSAPSRAPDTSCLASTWAGGKFAETRRERPAAPGSGGRHGFEVCAGSSGLAAPSWSAADAASPPLTVTLWRGARLLSLSASLSYWVASRALCTATSQLRFLPSQAEGDKTFKGGRRDVASALSNGDAAGLSSGCFYK